MISKELLSEVWGSEVTSIEDVRTMWDMQVLPFLVKELGGVCGFTDKKYHIAIETIAHKCKEWAFKQGYELFSRILSNDNQMRGNCLIIRVESDPETVLTITNADTELEAIFKACEWIMEQTK